MSADPPRIISFAVPAGAVCGGLLILITIASRNGLLMYIPYVVLGIVCAFYLRTQSIELFSRRFSIAFTAYAVATAIIGVYINAFVNPRVLRPLTLRNVVGPLAAMIVIGAVGSAVVALLAHSPHRDSVQRSRVTD
ncbi:MAG: hypothetical protein JO093_05700 [Acidobacteria bacterium]|nr:hypothetical protein [Acidobacteriota bacterium]MBV9068057.1 hypothetical protein [Acidobacteriota bacterium]MBV9185092.1 hypothetical protein [Acidobacteriota bacterium]